jgi:hypothetical protein
MMRVFERYPIYPVLVPPLIWLYIGLSGHVSTTDVISMVVFGIVVFGLAFLAMGWATQFRRAAVVALSTFVLLLLGGAEGMPHIGLLFLFLVGIGYLAAKLSEDLIDALNFLLNLTSLAFALLIGFNTVSFLMADGDPAWLDANLGCGATLSAGLAERGFAVPASVWSNYGQTILSMSSMYNMSYVSDWYEGASRVGPVAAITNNRTVDALAAMGYAIEQFTSEYSPLDLADARYFSPRGNPRLYQVTILSLSALGPVLEVFGIPALRVNHALHMRGLSWSLEHAGDSPRQDQIYRFVHLLAPHPPFIVESDGSYRPDFSHSTIHDGSHWGEMHGSMEGYKEGYCAKVGWVTPRLLEMVDGISAREPDAVILIHGDHGPGSELLWEEGANYSERMGVLLALRAPEAATSRLYDGMTLINVFPAIFGGVFGVEVPRQPDRVFWSTWSNPMGFSDVSDVFQLAP